MDNQSDNLPGNDEIRSNGNHQSIEEPAEPWNPKPRTGTESKPGTGRKPRPARKSKQSGKSGIEGNGNTPTKGEKKSNTSSSSIDDYLSEEEIDVLMSELPQADDTPIPQMPGLENITSASIVLTLLDGIVTISLGSSYVMNKDERKMIIEPLERIMARIPAAQIASYAPYVDPILLLMGLVSWGSRISRMKRTEAQTQLPKPAPKPIESPKSVAEQPKPKETINDEIMSVPTSLGIRIGE